MPAKNPDREPQRINLRILAFLQKEMQLEAARLINPEGTEIATAGSPLKATSWSSWEFEGNKLEISRSREKVSAPERVLIRAIEQLLLTLARRIQPEPGGGIGSVSFGDLMEIYLGAFKALEARTSLLENYERIMGLSRKVLMAEDLPSVLQIIMGMSAEALHSESSSLLLIDSRTGEMYFNIVSNEENRAVLEELRIPEGQGIAGSIVQSAKAEIIRDVEADPRAFTTVDQKLSQRTRDMTVAPLIVRGRVIGVIEVINSLSPHGFEEQDLEFLINLADHTSLLIENARTREYLIKSNTELDSRVTEVNALYEIGRSLNANLNPLDLRKRLLRSLLKFTHVSAGAILVRDGERRALVQEHELRIIDRRFLEAAPERVYRNATDLLIWMKQNREPFSFSRDLLNRPGPALRFSQENAEVPVEEYAPALWLPVFEEDDEDPAFIFVLRTDRYEETDAYHAAFFQAIMNQAQAAFRNVRSYEEALDSQRRERHIRQAFQRYVPERVVEEALEMQPRSVPKAVEASILFADLRSFTRVAEFTDPATLVQLLNEFFEEMEPVIDRRGGFIDKFMGDAIMAVFGAPDAQADDAANCLIVAHEMQERLQFLNARRREQKRPEFAMGVGVHRGSVVAGNIGASNRLDYTVIGDAVNLASRLESLTKFYKSGVLFSEAAYEAAGRPREPAVREIDLIQVRGRKSVNRVYEFINGRKSESLREWNQALELYRAHEFSRALEAYIDCANKSGADRVNEIYQERCQRYLETPPPETWDGVFRLDN